jgi:hypothetical protein
MDIYGETEVRLFQNKGLLRGLFKEVAYPFAEVARMAVGSFS